MEIIPSTAVTQFTKDLLDALDLSIIIIDGQNRIVHANMFARSLFPKTVSKKSKSVFGALGSGLSSEIKDSLAEVRSTQSTLIKENINVRIGGLRKNIDMKIAPCITQECEGYAMISVKDVTESIRLAAENKTIEEEYKMLMDKANDAIMVLDAAGRIIFANDATGNVLGLGAQSFYGEKAGNMFFTGRRKVGSFSSQKKPFKAKVNKDGKYVEIAATELKDKTMLIVRDISERMKFEEDLEKKNIELEEKNRNLLKITKYAIGREVKMAELKNKIKELS